MRKLIYLAGKYTDTGRTGVANNIMLARRYAIKLWDKGYTVICPHLNTAFFEDDCKTADYEDFMEGDFQIIQRCDMVYVLPNWRTSKGTKREIKFAKEQGIPVKFIRG